MPYEDLRRGRISTSGNFYSITTVSFDRRPYFLDLQLGRLVVAEMRRLDSESLVQSYAWVLMPDHLHWLFQLGDTMQLSDVIRTMKARSARRINDLLGRQGPIWQKAFHDHAIRKEEDLKAHARYLIANPIRKGLVRDVGNYPLWDAIWLSD